MFFFFFSSRRRHTRLQGDWSSDVSSSDLELGALVVGATVTLVAADETQRTATTNNDGVYTFNAVAPGAYTLRVASPGFTAYEKTDLAVGPRTTHDVRLVVTLEKQVITVTEDQTINRSEEHTSELQSPCNL